MSPPRNKLIKTGAKVERGYRAHRPYSGTSSFQGCQGRRAFPDWSLPFSSCEAQRRVVSLKHVGFLQIHPADLCPSLLQHFSRPQCGGGREGGYPAWHFVLLHRGPARPLPLLTEWSAPIPAWWSLVKDQPCMPRTFMGSGSAPTVQMERSQHVSGQYSSTQWERCWPPSWTASRSGRTSRPGRP